MQRLRDKTEELPQFESPISQWAKCSSKSLSWASWAHVNVYVAIKDIVLMGYNAMDVIDLIIKEKERAKGEAMN